MAERKVPEVAKVFNVTKGKLTETKDIRYSIETNREKIRVSLFSEPNYDLNGDWDPNKIITDQIKYLNRINPENYDNQYQLIIDKSVSTANEINIALDGVSCKYTARFIY